MPGPLRALVIEENEEQVRMLERALRGGGYDPTLRAVDTAVEMGNWLEKEKWQVILSSFALSYFNASAALEVMRKKGIDLPFIIVARGVGEEAAVAAIKAGAHDFILEQDVAKKLVPAIEREMKEAATRRSRKWTEDALRKNEARERAILESALDCIISFNHEGKIAEFNPAAEKAFGLPRAAVLGKDFGEVIVPTSWRDQYRRGMAQYLSKGDWPLIGKRTETTGVRADGTAFPMEMTLNAIRVEGPPMFTVVITDITERKAADEAMRQSGERVRTLLEGIDDALFVHDEEGRILDCNEAACRRLGYTRQELLSMRTGDIDAPEFAEAFYERLAQQAATGKCNFEGVHVAKDGRRVNVDINTSVINYQGRGAVLAVMRDITARKQQEIDLRESQAFYHSLVENLPQNILRKDLDGKFTFANQRACNILNRPIEEIVAKTDYDFFPKELADKYRADDKKVVETGEIFETIEENLPPGGGKIYVHVIKTPIRDAKGDIIGTQVIFWDETERQRAAEEIRRAQLFLDAVVENLPTMVFAKEAKELRNVLWNKAAEEICGIAREDVKGKNDYDFQPKEKAEFFVRKDREVLKDKKLLDIPEETIQSQHRGERILHTRKVPILDDKGNPLYLLGIAEDITERKRSEDALRETEAFYHSLVENVPLNIFRKDLSGRFTFGNKKFYDTMGKPPEQIMGKSDYDFFPKELADKYRADDKKVVETGEVFETIEENEPPGGERRYVQVVKSPIRDSTGKTIGTQCFFWDVTDRIRADELSKTTAKV